MFGVNVNGVANGVRSFVPAMLARGEPAWVVNTASVAGLVCPPDMAVYSASKHAVVAMSECLHHELAQTGKPASPHAAVQAPTAPRRTLPMSDPVILERRDGMAFITLNRPERANVLDFETSAALIAAIDAVAADASVRAVLLQARGRHFCAGGNIGDFVDSLHDLAGLLDRTSPPLHGRRTRWRRCRCRWSVRSTGRSAAASAWRSVATSCSRRNR